MKDSNGESARYKYTAKGFLEEVVDSTGATGSYLYDTNGQIKKVNLSDGSSVSFQYEWYCSKEAKDAVLRKIKVTHTTAKVVSSPITVGKSPRLDKAKDGG